MSNKIMDLIELAMQFKENDKVVSINYSSHTDGVYVYVLDRKSNKTVYSKDCYLKRENATERLDLIKLELENLLIEKAA